MALGIDLLEPLAGSNPAGEYLRYEPIYDQIKLARTEEDDVPQGEWKRERKTADYGLVLKLATDVLAKRSKDLQIAAWLTEALVHREGFAGLREGLDLLRGLVETFWDHVHPELEEDDDAEMRAVPLEWIGSYLDVAVRSVPINRSGHDFIGYKESRAVPDEDEAEADSAKRVARTEAVEAGKLTPEAWEEGFASTPKSWYKQLAAELDGALDSLDALDRVGQEKFGDVAPNYMRLRDALREVRQVAGQLLAKKLELDPDPPEEVEAEAAAEGLGGAEGEASGGGEPVGGGRDGGPGVATVSGAGAGTTVGAATGAAKGAAGSLSPMPRSREDAASRVAAAARYMRTETPTDPAPYLLLRGFRWGELRGRGGDVDPKLLAAPPTEVRTRLKGLLLDEHWADLLESAEEVMASAYGRGWLDLQRYVLAACDGLGGEYDAVAAAVRGALRSLLTDLPQLPDLTLMDDSPTANAETRAWLRDAGIEPSDAELEAAGPADGPSPVRRVAAGRGAWERAQERVRAGQAQQAIEILMREASQETSPRARFIRRSQAARIMVDSGLEAVAVPILNELLTQIEEHSLESWEDGETIAEPLGLLYRCARKLELGIDTDDLYLRICRLDPMQAIHFANPQPSDVERVEAD